jgi:hypothetical protein
MSYDTFIELRRHLDGNEPYMNGHQILKERRIARKAPLWTKNDKRVQAILLRSFPKMETNQKQRDAAGKWVRVLHLYYRMGLTFGQVAAEMGITRDTVSDIVQCLTRASKGLRADGSKRKLGRKRGRPSGLYGPYKTKANKK